MNSIADCQTILECIAARDRDWSITIPQSADLAAARRYSSSEILRHAGSAAELFRRQGVRPGDRIVFFLDTSADLIAGALGAWAVGAITTIQPIHWPEDHKALFASRLRSILRQTAPSLVIVQDSLCAAVGSLMSDFSQTGIICQLISASDFALFLESEFGSLEPILATGSAIAHLQFTSGSTGEPKGVPVRHRQIVLHSLWGG